MEYRIRATGDVMLESELRQWSKDSNGPSWDQTTLEILDELGVDPVLEGPYPTLTRYQIAFRDGVEQIDNQWFTKYKVVDLDADGIAAKNAEQAKNMRNQRNDMLTKSDWTQLADSTADKQAWAVYRQALRDITLQSDFPWNVTWPTQP